MKNNFSYISVVLIALIASSSCTRNINLKLGNASGQLVIEGNITNINGPQYVTLSANVPFTNTNTYPPVTGALVTVSDQSGNNYTLREGPQGTYSSQAFSGTAGTAYKLNVLAAGQDYTASSAMPGLVALDSVTDRTRPLNKPQNGKDQKVVTVYYQDPAGISNQYRFVLWVNGVQVDAIFAYNDELTDGRYVSLDLLEQDIDIYAGDTIKVEMQCVDEPMYLYWDALEQQQFNPLYGSAAPTNPPTNLSPTALGYFSAHTTQTRTIVVR